MKRLVIIMSLIPLFACGSATHPGRCAIKQFPLDDRSIYEIPIGTNVPTTIMFPGKISSISGANITKDPEIQAPILLSHAEGRYFFTLKALKHEAQGAANIVYKNKTYVLSFYSSDAPARSIKFYESEQGPNGYSSWQKRVTPEVLLGVLDRAKSYHFLNMQYPEAVQQIDIACPNSKTLYKDYEVVTEEIMRFDQEDTLVFKIRLKNKTDEEIYYQPQRLAVRVSQNLYFASIADASGIIPPFSETSAYFAITGKPNGGRANLSVRNNFNVIVMQVEDVSLIIPGKC